MHLNGRTSPPTFPGNKIANQKYSLWSFIPKVLWNQFSQFYNLFFLAICMSQCFPILRIGFAYTYITPLVFVIIVAMLFEAYADLRRWCRDRELNSAKYSKLQDGHNVDVPSAYLQVGDIIELRENQRVPADVVLLWTSDKTETAYIRTDQLDGETDWKLRRAISRTHAAVLQNNLRALDGYVRAEAPHRDIYKFMGTFYSREGGQEVAYGLALEHTIWADSVLASGRALGLVIYTGQHTKTQQNARLPRSKSGRIDTEISGMSFVMFIVLTCLALVVLVSNGFHGAWHITFARHVLLLSSIIPISLRVNMDIAKAFYSYKIGQDEIIPGTVAHNPHIPEDLGRVQLLLSDKTGTLTQNEMDFKALYVDNVKYSQKDGLNEIIDQVRASCQVDSAPLGDLDLARFQAEGPGRRPRRERHHCVRMRD